MQKILNFSEITKEQYIIQKTDEFTYELEEIALYIVQHYYYDTIDKFQDKLKEKLDVLKTNPMAYKEYKENTKYRYIVMENYKIFYKVDIKDKIVYLCYIIDSRRKYFHLI